MSRLEELRRIAASVGIATRHVDALGVWHEGRALTAGFGVQWPCEKARDSNSSARLLARESARRTRRSLNGGFESLKPVAPLVNHVYSEVCRPGLRWRATGAL